MRAWDAYAGVMQDEYRTVARAGVHETEVNRSRFLCALAPAATEREARDFIARVRKEHADATHNCFAYVIGADAAVQKASDDGEPGGTAGVPMLQMLLRRDMRYVVAVVTRYYGGVKLGAPDGRQDIVGGGGLRGSERHLLALGNHTQEVPVPHDGDDSRQCHGRTGVDVLQAGTARGGSHHSAVQHPVQREVVHEPRTWRQLVRQVDPRHIGADDPIGRDRLRLCDTGSRAIEQSVVGEFPVCRGSSIGCGDGAVGDHQLLFGHVPPGGGRPEIDQPRLGTGRAQRGAGMLDGQAARRVPLVGTGAGGRSDHPHARDVDVQLLGGDLGQRGEHALPEFDLARVHFDHAGG